jgi:hypothetical protein
MAERKSVLLRLDPAVHDALAKWAADEMRSTNAQIEFLLRRALTEARRMPGHARQMRGPGRPPREDSEPELLGKSLPYDDRRDPSFVRHVLRYHPLQ